MVNQKAIFVLTYFGLVMITSFGLAIVLCTQWLLPFLFVQYDGNKFVIVFGTWAILLLIGLATILRIANRRYPKHRE